MKWVDSFLRITEYDGHQAKNVTHLLVAHIPHQMSRLDGIRRFSGQRKTTYSQLPTKKLIIIIYKFTLEKNNDDARRYYHSSNSLDGGREIVLANVRQEQLGHCSRQKRRYEKCNLEYWSNGILEKRRRDSQSDDAE